MRRPLQSTLVVMPALNEEQSIGAVIAEVQRSATGAAILVVDDGSTDSTARVAREAGALVAPLPFNLGVGGAMRVGFRYATAHGFSNVVQVDADGQHDPGMIPQLVAALDDLDIAVGARFAGRGDYSAGPVRRLVMWVFSVVLSGIARTKLTDSTSGFKASGPRAVRLFAEDYPAEYLGDTVEALVIASRAGMRIGQVPVEMRARTGGTPSHNPVKAAAYLARATMALLVALMRPRTGGRHA